MNSNLETNPPDLRSVAAGFQIYGSYLEARAYGGGHINDTYVVALSQAGNRIRYILQRINNRIFKNRVELMENIARVTQTAWTTLQNEGVLDVSRRTLSLVPALNGGPLHTDAEGREWRCYPFIENARTYDIIENAQQAREAARAFGEFQRLVSGISGPRLHETILRFHDTRSRLDRLKQAVAEDKLGRLAEVAKEWAFVQAREPLTGIILDLLASGAIPERVTHNDTKLNNVMIDDATGTGICVIDLDTVMPGASLYDFGDMVRTATSPALEDAPDLTKVTMQMPMFTALVQGFLQGTGGMLNEAEKAHLVDAGKIITLECGIRFLTDYLEGDTYFKIKRPAHNLDRCRTQFALVQSIETQEIAMRQLVDSVSL